MKRRDALDVVCLVLAIIIGVAVAGVFVIAQAQSAPGILLHVERADYHDGLQVTDCWLRAGPGALIVTGSYVSAECVSDVDGVFTDGFEAAQ